VAEERFCHAKPIYLPLLVEPPVLVGQPELVDASEPEPGLQRAVARVLILEPEPGLSLLA
jgi:hypothetical protein